jgi:CHAT domain-containing protein
VVYVQSIPTLRVNYELYKDRRTTANLLALPKATIVHSLPSDADSARPTKILACSVQGTLHQGVDLVPSEVLGDFESSTFVHYHGHVEFNPDNAMSSELALDYERVQIPDSNPDIKPQSGRITAKDIWGTNLNSPPYLVNIIGCGSGRAQNLGSDDRLGFPTVFQFMGASAVVSTLWRIGDIDGSDFSEAFFLSLQRQKEELQTPLSPTDELDLALAVQEALNALRQRSSDDQSVEYKAAYYWAGFILHGYWKIPAWCIDFRKE